jgi:hypothetical protein
VGMECFRKGGVGPAPYVRKNWGALMPEGLAPTYRSGVPFDVNPGVSGHSEDLGFWWMHDPQFVGSGGYGEAPGVGKNNVAHNGNPKPCGQGSCNRNDWQTNAWAPDMQLHEATWSTAGRCVKHSRSYFVHALLQA